MQLIPLCPVCYLYIDVKMEYNYPIINPSQVPNNPNFIDHVINFVSCLGHGSFGIVLKIGESIDNSSENENRLAIKFLIESSSNSSFNNDTTIDKLKEAGKHSKVMYVRNFVTDKELNPSQMETILKLGPPQFRQFYEMEWISGRGRPLKWTCIQMELCGHTLSKWINNEKEATPESVQTQMKQTVIVLSLISGLDFLHKNEIIHGNLKSENIMFSKGYELPIKIGLPKIDDRPQIGIYTAMEVQRGAGSSIQSDLFSLGLLLWEVVGLIKTDEKAELFERLVFGREDHLVGGHPLLGMGVKKAIIRLTKKQVDDRMQSVEELEEMRKKWQINEIEGSMFASDGDDLKLCLKFASNGAKVLLGNGIFQGGFVIRSENVTLQGQGHGQSVIETGTSGGAPGLQIRGNNCTIIDIVVKVGGGKTGILVGGSENKMHNVSIIAKDGGGGDGASIGMRIDGCNNVMDSIKLENVNNLGIFISPGANENILRNVSGLSVVCGLHIRGSKNVVENATFIKSGGDGGASIGVSLLSTGSHNVIQNLNCVGYQTDKDWGLEVNSPYSSLSGGHGGPILINANYAILSNVDCGELLEIGTMAKGVKVLKCKGDKLKSISRIVLEACEFSCVCIK